MKYVYLTLAGLMALLAAGDQPLALAPWLAPVFLLRFIRSSGPLRGFLLALVVMSAGNFLGYREMIPGPILSFALSVVAGALLDLVPFACDRLLTKRLSDWASTLVLPTAMVTLAWVLSLGPNGATSIAPLLAHDDLILLQLVSVTGIWGLIFLAYWAAATINLVWEKGLHHRPARRLSVAFATVLVLVYGFGAMRLSHAVRPDNASVRVAAITPDLEQREKLLTTAMAMIGETEPTPAEVRSFRSEALGLVAALLESSDQQARSGCEVVAWSEAAVAALAEDEAQIRQQAQQVAAARGIYLAIALGVVEDDFRARRARGEPFLHIKMILIAPDGSTLWEYNKTKLVPGMMESRTAIPGDGRLHLAKTPFGLVTGVICFDLDFPQLMRPAGRKGAGIVIVPANDWKEIRRTHVRLARVRTIENGFALLRPTSNGVSLAADSYGRIAAEVDYFSAAGAPLVAELPIQPVPTLYSVLGDVFAYVCIAGLALLGILGVAGQGLISKMRME